MGKVFEKVDDDNFKTREEVEEIKGIAVVKEEFDREQAFKRSIILEHNKRLAESNARLSALQNTIDQAKLVGVELKAVVAEEILDGVKEEG